MRRKAVSAVMLTLLLTSMLTLAFNIQPVRGWTGTVYIRADGSIDPPDAPIITYDYVTYTLTDNITSDGDGIVVERDNIIIDGASYTLQGPGKKQLWVYPLKGIDLSHRYNVTIKNIKIDSFRPGIYLYNSSRNMINDNVITNSFRTSIYACGITLESSSDNIIAYNRILNFTWAGIYLIRFSYRNRITNNHIISTDVRDGIHLYGLSSANITNNVFVNSGLYPRLTFPYLVENNTVNGKPLIYLQGVSGYTIDGSEQEAGQIIVVSSYNITIKNVSLSNTNIGIGLFGVWDSEITNSSLISNKEGIRLDGSNNLIAHNNFENNSYVGLSVGGSKNLIMNNIFRNVLNGLSLGGDDNHVIFNNFIEVSWVGVGGTDNYVYLNNFLQSQAGSTTDSTTIWNTPMKIFYTYEENTYSNYTGNYWDDYEGRDTNSDGIGDSSYNINADKDYYPLMNPFENYRYYPNIRVTSPNGNENWLVGSYQSIEWKSFMLFTRNVTIELSTDAGATWEGVLFASTDNDGVERWRVMAYPGNQLRIRVANLADPSVSDISDSNFSITTVSQTNTFPVGYCTWWAFERRAQLGMPIDWLNEMPRPRHAYKWIDFAQQAGVPTGSEPRSGAIAVWGATATNSFGHVAIVEWVEIGQAEENGEVQAWLGISEMNFGSFIDPDEGITENFRKVTDRTLTFPRPPEENFLGFIYEAVVPDFSISASPTSLTIRQGDSSTSTITITSIGGFNQPVELTVSGAPSGVTATLDPEQVTPPPDGSTTSTLTVLVSAAATPGSYTLTVTGTNGTLTHSVDISLVITTLPPLDEPPVCVIKLQKDGVEISEINVEEFFDIYVGDSTDDTGIAQVRFSSDDSQDGVPTGEWTDWYDWDISSEDWDASTKIKRWSFATTGAKEVWAEVKDEANQTAKSSSDFYVTVPPLEKRLVVGDRPFVPIAELKVKYEWVDRIDAENIYKVSKIQMKLVGFTGYYRIFIRDHAKNTLWSSWGLSGINLDKSYFFEAEPLTVRDSYEIGISLKGTDDIVLLVKPFLKFTDWYVKAVEAMLAGPYAAIIPEELILEMFKPEDVKMWEELPIFVSETSITQFNPESPEITEPATETPDIHLAYISSPVELRVYDPEGRVTGLINGEVKEEIPNSEYFNNTVIILSPSDLYHYEVAGTQEGSYGLLVASLVQGESNVFTATDIPISTNAIHQYTVDWEVLSAGEEGVTVKVDSEGDGTFELTFTSDSELTQEEYRLQLPRAEGFPMWTLGVAVASIAIISAAVVVFWKRRKQPPIKR